MRRPIRGASAALVACTALLSACATTVNETGTGTDIAASGVDADTTVNGGTIIDPDARAAPVVLEGSAAELLPIMSTEMSRLGSEIAEGGDAKTTLANIEQIWENLQPEIDAERPELLSGIKATVEMAQLAVERKRPADADKAFSLLTDIVAQFNG